MGLLPPEASASASPGPRLVEHCGDRSRSLPSLPFQGRGAPRSLDYIPHVDACENLGVALACRARLSGFCSLVWEGWGDPALFLGRGLGWRVGIAVPGRLVVWK